MSWFCLSALARLCRSGAELFSNLGCRGSGDRVRRRRMASADAVTGLFDESGRSYAVL